MTGLLIGAAALLVIGLGAALMWLLNPPDVTAPKVPTRIGHVLFIGGFLLRTLYLFVEPVHDEPFVTFAVGVQIAGLIFIIFAIHESRRQ